MTSGEAGRKSLSMLASTWAGGAMNFLAAALVARVLGPDAVGALGFSFGLAGLALAALLPGFTQAHMKRVAEGRDLSVCVATFAAIKLALYGLLAAVLTAGSIWRMVLFDTPRLETVFYLLLAARLLSNFAEVFTTALLARERVVEQAVVLVVSRALRLAGTVTAVFVTADIRWVAAAYVLEGAAELGTGAALTRARLALTLRRPTWESVTAYWRYARPLLVVVPLGMAQDSLDRVVVKQWAGLTAAGYYHVARGLWEVLASIAAYPSMLLFTRMSALFAARTPETGRAARALFYSGVDKLLFVSVPLALGVWVLAPHITVLVFGAAFAPAASAVRVFVLAVVAANVLNPYTQVLYATERHARLVPVVLLRFTVFIVALAVLVPAAPVAAGVPALGLGSTGAAVARLLLLLFPAWVYVRWSRDLAGVGFHRPSAIYAAALLAALGVFEAGSRLLASTSAVAADAVAGALALAVYTGIVAATHPSFRDTLSYCAALLNPARFVVFIRKEVDKP